MHSTLVVGDDLYLWFSWTDSHVFLCSAGGSRGLLQKAPEFNSGASINVDQPSWTARPSSWTARSSCCGGQSQVCSLSHFALLTHLAPATHTTAMSCLLSEGRRMPTSSQARQAPLFSLLLLISAHTRLPGICFAHIRKSVLGSSLNLQAGSERP